MSAGRRGPRSALLARKLFWLFKSGPVSAAEARRALGGRWMPVLMAKGYIHADRAKTRGRKATISLTDRGRRRLELEMRRAGTGGEE